MTKPQIIPLAKGFIPQSSQCVYCQSEQIMTAVAFLKQNPVPEPNEIRMPMHNNICRCEAYNRIEKAVTKAAEKIKKQQ
jgi:isoquinoline 1-oxidoreductase alpha subunit